jgi:hypothetical protein
MAMQEDRRNVPSISMASYSATTRERNPSAPKLASWLLSRKADAAADILNRLFMTRSCPRMSIGIILESSAGPIAGSASLDKLVTTPRTSILRQQVATGDGA